MPDVDIIRHLNRKFSDDQFRPINHEKVQINQLAGSVNRRAETCSWTDTRGTFDDVMKFNE